MRPYPASFFAASVFGIAVATILNGCWIPPLGPPPDEVPLDMTFQSDNTAVLSTSRGRLLATTDQGDTWDRNFFFDEVANIYSGSLHEFVVASNEVYIGYYQGPLGRPSLSSFPTTSLAVSCDGARSFNKIGDGDGWYGVVFVHQPDGLPLVLDGSSMFEFTTAGTCPDGVRAWGETNPTGSIDSAAVCGELMYQASDARVFSTSDRGETWLPNWDFFARGAVHVRCQGNHVWAFHSTTGRIIKRAADSLEFFEVGSLDANYSLGNAIAIAQGSLLFVAGHDWQGLGIRSMNQAGETRDHPVPSINTQNEYLLDFEIAPDGVFWIVTDRAVYRDDVNEVWAKVWP